MDLDALTLISSHEAHFFEAHFFSGGVFRHVDILKQSIASFSG